MLHELHFSLRLSQKESKSNIELHRNQPYHMTFRKFPSDLFRSKLTHLFFYDDTHYAVLFTS